MIFEVTQYRCFTFKRVCVNPPKLESSESDQRRRTHRDGRRRVTPDPSVYISNFDFNTTAEDQLMMHQFKSQLSRRRNLRRRLQRKRNNLIAAAAKKKNNGLTDAQTGSKKFAKSSQKFAKVRKR